MALRLPLYALLAIALNAFAQITESTSSMMGPTSIDGHQTAKAASIISVEPCGQEVIWAMACTAGEGCEAWQNQTAVCTMAPTSVRCELPTTTANNATSNIPVTGIMGCNYPNTTVPADVTCLTVLTGSIDGTDLLKTLDHSTFPLTAPPPAPSNISVVGLKGDISVTGGQEKLSALNAGCSSLNTSSSPPVSASPTSPTSPSLSPTSSLPSSSTGMAAVVTAMQELFKVPIPIGVAIVVGAGVVM